MEKVKRGSVAIFVPHVGCSHRCSFCDQRTISGTAILPGPEDVKSACERALECGAKPENTEIAFFGGSFTAIPKDYMQSLLDAAQPYLKAGFMGIRLSTRPDAVDKDILKHLKDCGVRSIELGAQSMSDVVLTANGRGHTSHDVRRASELIKEQGFVLGLQMMAGLYRSTPELDRMTARELIKLRPDESRIYPTVILKNTRLGELYLSGEYKPYTMETAILLCSELLEMFESEGISVIKLGLHSSRDVEKDMLGGIYHPALREICESEIFKRKMEALIGDKKKVTFYVPARELSKAVGQNRSNIEYFRAKGIDVIIKPDGALEDGIKIHTEVQGCI